MNLKSIATTLSLILTLAIGGHSESGATTLYANFDPTAGAPVYQGDGSNGEFLGVYLVNYNTIAQTRKLAWNFTAQRSGNVGKLFLNWEFLGRVAGGVARQFYFSFYDSDDNFVGYTQILDGTPLAQDANVVSPGNFGTFNAQTIEGFVIGTDGNNPLPGSSWSINAGETYRVTLNFGGPVSGGYWVNSDFANINGSISEIITNNIGGSPGESILAPQPAFLPTLALTTTAGFTGIPTPADVPAPPVLALMSAVLASMATTRKRPRR